MHLSYKIKIFSGDGQTFIRASQINIPTQTSSGEGSIATENFGREATGPSAFADAIALMTAKAWWKVDLDFACTYISGGSAATYSGFGGATSVIDLVSSFGTPTAGKAVRFVFNNGNYVKLTYNSATPTQSNGWIINYTLSYHLKENDEQLAALTFQNEWPVDPGYAKQGNIIPFPFPLPNRNGTYTDFNIRMLGSSSTPYGTSGMVGCYDTNGQKYYCMIPFFRGYGATLRLNNNIERFFTGLTPIDTDDPYQDIDDSTPSGPAEGTGIPENDPVDIPDLPTVSAIDTGFVSLFNPTLAEVKSLADYMWTDTLFDINNFRKIFADPMDCILGFNVVPVNVPSSGRGYVCVGNIQSTVQMTLATSQWVEVNCGSLDLGLPYGNYLDFAPASKYSIYLPYIGIKELSTDDVAGKVLTLKYHVDVLSCACIAYLKCGDSVLYQFAGSCGYSIPVTGTDFSRMIGSIIDIGLQAGSLATGNVNAVGSIAKDVMGLKPDVHRAGSIGSSTGLMGLQVPFLILELPNACKPAKQYHYLGYPSFVTVKLSDITGFASFENVLLEGIPCTDAEREIILSMCKGGIYL